jgi:hypothetical protein
MFPTWTLSHEFWSARTLTAVWPVWRWNFCEAGWDGGFVSVGRRFALPALAHVVVGGGSGWRDGGRRRCQRLQCKTLPNINERTESERAAVAATMRESAMSLDCGARVCSVYIEEGQEHLALVHSLACSHSIQLSTIHCSLSRAHYKHGNVHMHTCCLCEAANTCALAFYPPRASPSVLFLSKNWIKSKVWRINYNDGKNFCLLCGVSVHE